MPYYTDVIIIKNESVEQFRNSDNYKPEYLIAELESSDGARLFLFKANKSVRVQDIQPEHFLCISIDDESDFNILGGFSDIPFDIKVNSSMSFIIDKNDAELTQKLIKYFDYSVMQDEKFNQYCSIYNNSELDQYDFFEQNTELHSQLALILKQHDLELYDFIEIAEGTHYMNSYKDLCIDTSDTTGTTFICKFKLGLSQLVEYQNMNTSDDLANEFALDTLNISSDEISCSLFDTFDDNGLYEILAQDIYELEHYLHLDVYGLKNVDHIFWKGELKLNDDADIKIIHKEGA